MQNQGTAPNAYFAFSLSKSVYNDVVFARYLINLVNCDEENGEREDRDKEDREQHESAGDILQEEEWSAEESL